jgi:hypothetical protein
MFSNRALAVMGGGLLLAISTAGSGAAEEAFADAGFLDWQPYRLANNPAGVEIADFDGVDEPDIAVLKNTQRSRRRWSTKDRTRAR